MQSLCNLFPNKIMSIDPELTFLDKNCANILLSPLTKLVNWSLLRVLLLKKFKKVVVTPLIKKASVPSEDFRDYHPVSG